MAYTSDRGNRQPNEKYEDHLSALRDITASKYGSGSSDPRLTPSATKLPNVWIPYITITFSNISLTWRGEEGRPDYFTSLTHERFVDRANVLKINIAYAPKVGEDPNRIEDAIVRSGGECFVQYGNATGYSRKYKALVYTYSVNINEGILEYSFELLSAAVSYNFTSVTESFSTIPKSAGGDASSMFIVALVRIKKVINKYLGPSGNFAGYVFDAEGSDNLAEITLPKGGFTIEAGLNPFQFLLRMVSYFICDKSYDMFYVLEVDDSETGPGKIRIKKVDPTKSSATYTFTWGSKNGTVLSFSPKFNGSYAIFSARTGQTYDGKDNSDWSDYVTKSGITQNGTTYNVITNVTVDKSDFRSYEPLKDLADTAKSVKEYVDKGLYCYEASLVVLGEPHQVSLGSTVIYVNPLIQGKSHHTAGYYVVKGVTDTVNASGFTTEYKLYRSPDQSGRVYKKPNDISKSTYIYADGEMYSYGNYDPYSGR